MSCIAIPSLNDSPEGSKPTLDAVHKQLGVVPNLYRLIGNSPAALNAFASFQGGLSKSLGVKTHERIALAVAQVNGCGYCLSAHTYLGLNLAKISPEEIALNRKGASGDAKDNAAVAFAARWHGSAGMSATPTSPQCVFAGARSRSRSGRMRARRPRRRGLARSSRQ